MKLRDHLFASAALVAMMVSAPADVLGQDSSPISFKIISGTMGTPADVLMKKYWSSVGDETDSQIVARVQAREELGLQGPEVYRMAKLGVAEVTSTALAYNAGEIPENDGVDLTGLVYDVATLRQVADAWYPELRKAYEQVGVELIGIFPAVAQILWCAVPVKSLDDLKGKKIRVSGVAVGKLIGGLGAVPTTLPFAEVVPALQRHVVDCAVSGTTSGNLNKWTDVATHVYPMVTGWAMQGIYANKGWWAGLHPDTRKAMAARMDDMVDESWQIAEAESDQGLWCSVGDPRCEPTSTIKPLGEYDLTLAPFTDADKQKLREIAEREVLPDFAQRCGEECTQAWNETVGALLGVEASSS